MLTIRLGFADRAAEAESLWMPLAIGAALGFLAWLLVLVAGWSESWPYPQRDRAPEDAGATTRPAVVEAAPDGAVSAAAAGSSAQAGAAEPAFARLRGWPDAIEAASLFADEGRDQSWSAQTERGLLDTLSQFTGFAAHSVAVECRESLCRIELIFAAGNSALYSIRQLYDRIGELGLGPVLAEPADEVNGTQTWQIYLRRR